MDRLNLREVRGVQLVLMGWWLRRLGLIFLALAIATAAYGQHPQIVIPEGARHFIVLVDSSASMVARSLPPAPPNTKRKALAAAQRELSGMLFSSGRVVNGPWYRRGKDLITVVQYGIDTKPRVDQAYLRLKDAKLDDDYVRKIINANRQVTRKQFMAALNPRVHTHLNILAWALPMGISASAVPGTPVQETFVILLNDAQMNDGSMVLEKQTMGMHLNDAARRRLAAKEKLVDDSVRLSGKSGMSNPWLSKSFGEGSDLVLITAFKANPTTTATAVEGLSHLSPLDSLRIDAVGSRLHASFDPESDLKGVDAILEVRGDQKALTASFHIQPHISVSVPSVTGKRAMVTLAISKAAGNPLLGIQKFQILYEQPTLLPAGARIRSIALWVFVLAILAGFAAWVYYHAVLARHFHLWLPGYVTSFELPAISQRVSSRHLLRVPTYSGELAAVLTLPSPIIRFMLYRKATLKWDPKLSVVGINPKDVRAKLTELPTLTKFVWQDRPSNAGEFELTIERPIKYGRNQRGKIYVRFLSLPAETRLIIGKP